jgi:site-specific DNA-methyltransferase (adenine-specific)
VLDPFAGSGSTGVDALQSGRQFIGIERELEYWLIAHASLSAIDSLVKSELP